jgi:flagellar protein FlaG
MANPSASGKGNHMSNEITSAIPSHMSPPHALRTPPAPQVGDGIAHPDLKAPTRPNIQYDPAQLQRNLAEAIKRLNEHMQSSGRNLSFSMDNATHQMVIVVKNNTTGEVIRQIPEEAVLRVAHNMDQIKGLLHNTHI